MCANYVDSIGSFFTISCLLVALKLLGPLPQRLLWKPVRLLKHLRSRAWGSSHWLASFSSKGPLGYTISHTKAGTLNVESEDGVIPVKGIEPIFNYLELMDMQNGSSLVCLLSAVKPMVRIGHIGDLQLGIYTNNLKKKRLETLHSSWCMELKLSFPGHQSTIGSTASIGRHRKRWFTQIDPPRGRWWQPPVQEQERKAWHDRQLHQKPLFKRLPDLGLATRSISFLPFGW